MIFFTVVFLTVGSASAFFQPGGAIQTTWLTKDWTESLLRPSRSTTSALRYSWSNGQAVKEYQNFLEGKDQPAVLTEDVPSCIVVPAVGAAGPIADLIASLRSASAEHPDVIIPTDGIPPKEIGGNTEYPIYVALSNPDQLSDFLDMVMREGPWVSRASDLVLFSGGELPGSAQDLDLLGYSGCIEPHLRSRGLARDSTTQVLLNFKFPRASAIGRVMSPQDYATVLGPDAMGNDKWTGETATCGKWRQAASLRLSSGGLHVRECFYRDWRRAMWERVTFDAVFGCIGSIRDDRVSMKDVALYYGEETSDMLWEATGLLRGCLAVTITYGFEERMFGFAEAMGEVDCGMNEELFRRCNGVFCDYELADATKVPRSGLEKGMRKHSEYVAYASTSKGLIGERSGGRVVLSQRILNIGSKAEVFLTSAMLQGNLRCDGAI